jgi:hypothetical protein
MKGKTYADAVAWTGEVDICINISLLLPSLPANVMTQTVPSVLTFTFYPHNGICMILKININYITKQH